MPTIEHKLCHYPPDVWCTNAISGDLRTEKGEVALPDLVNKIDPQRRCLWIQEHAPENCLEHKHKMGLDKEG